MNIDERKDSPMLTQSQHKILNEIDGSSIGNWTDWKWQLKHCVKDIDTFETLLNINLSEELRLQFQLIVEKFPMSITPYYLSLIDTDNLENDPIFKQSFPVISEIQVQKNDMVDPLDEDRDSPVPGLTHRYPDRVLLLVSNTCAMYCRHCTRKRRVGENDTIPSREHIMEGIEYIRRTPRIRDVLLSGGDPFLLSTDYLDWILSELKKIGNVEVIRIGTRTPAVLPYRIKDELVEMLKKHHPLWINTHFNHPRELTASSKSALRKLADAGIPMEINRFCYLVSMTVLGLCVRLSIN
jgi:lysine 2,3-aminomutase